MMRTYQIGVIVITLLLVLGRGYSQQLIDARGTGMAFSNSAATVGLEQVGLNPATLALPHWAHFELNIFSANLSVTNNSFNRGLYDRYFTTGDTLTSNDKTTLLNSIPTAGLQGRLAARVNTLAVYMPNFSLSLTGIGNGRVNLPREIAELAFLGNDEPGRVYDFSSTDAAGWGGMAIQAGYAKRFMLQNNRWFDMMAIGVTAKYLAGLGYFEVMKSRGTLQNGEMTNPFLKFDGEIEARSARGGSGWAMDLGIVLNKTNQFTFSLALLNPLGHIRWQSQTEMRHYAFHTDSLALSTNGIADSLTVSEDTTYVIDAFSTRMPTVLDVGAAYRANRSLLLTLEMEQGVSNSMGGNKALRVAMGAEFTLLPFLPLRSGISLGGNDGFSFAFGSGLNLHFWYVDVGVVNHGGFSARSSRGLTLAMTTRFRF